MKKACFFLAFTLVVAGIGAQNRTALLIANGNYMNFGKLANPLPEARALGAELKKLGFAVSLVEDAGREAMVDALAEFEAALKVRGGIAFFHYGGHGVQVGGRNYLMPANADVPDEKRVASRCVDLDEVMTAMESGGSDTNIVVLDACRNNPLPASSGRSATRGLAVVGTKPRNSIIIYSAEAGSVAQDGLFTPALTRALAAPGQSLNQLAMRVRREVYDASKGAQTTGEYNQLFSEVYLAGAGGAASTGAAPAAALTTSVAPAAVPTLTVSRSYGSLQISAATAGSLYLDGKAMGELPAGAEAKLDSIEVGEHSLELRYSSGDREAKSATVQKGQNSPVVFAWKKAAPPPATAPAPVGFVTVPAGSFTMGSPASESSRSSDEGPQHEVRLSTFSIGQYEVTQAEWHAVMGSNPSLFKGDKLPVERVSWYDILVYCNKRSMNEGLSPCYSISGSTDPARWGSVPTSSNSTWDAVSCDFSANGYRLPTEAEWEYAAKGGSASGSLASNAVYAGSAELDSVAWYYFGLSDDSTHPVGHKKANALGLYDMAGNVREWCWDWYKDTYYASSPGTDPRGAENGSYRVLRGGDWGDYGYGLRSALRDYSDQDSRGYFNGFRVVVGR